MTTEALRMLLAMAMIIAGAYNLQHALRTGTAKAMQLAFTRTRRPALFWLVVVGDIAVSVAGAVWLLVLLWG